MLEMNELSCLHVASPPGPNAVVEQPDYQLKAQLDGSQLRWRTIVALQLRLVDTAVEYGEGECKQTSRTARAVDDSRPVTMSWSYDIT